MSKSFKLRKLPKHEQHGLGGGNRYMDRALPSLPYSAVMPMYPMDDRMVWSPQSVMYEVSSRVPLRMPDLQPVKKKPSISPPADPYMNRFQGGSYYYNPQATADLATVPENARAFWGGSFRTEPFLHRTGVWGS